MQATGRIFTVVSSLIRDWIRRLAGCASIHVPAFMQGHEVLTVGDLAVTHRPVSPLQRNHEIATRQYRSVPTGFGAIGQELAWATPFSTDSQAKICTSRRTATGIE